MKAKPIITEFEVSCIRWCLEASKAVDAESIATVTTAKDGWESVERFLNQKGLIQRRKGGA